VPPTALPGSGRSKRAKVSKATPAAVPAAALVTPRRALDTAFTIENEYLQGCWASVRRTRSWTLIGQCLVESVEAHRLAVEAGVTGLNTLVGGFASLMDADVAVTIKLLGDLQVTGQIGSAVLPNQISLSGTLMIQPWTRRRMR
jgi:hypothetical protein